MYDMPFRQILLEKLNEALLVGDPVTNTNRDARLRAITGKVCTVIGMRRAAFFGF